jgi:hypothetical protein
MVHDEPCPHTSSIGNIGTCLRPRHVPELACSGQRLLFICFDNAFLSVESFYDYLYHVTDFFYAYSVLAKPE